LSIRRHNAKRDANEPSIVRVFEDMGCAVARMDQPCDLLIRCRDRLALVEVKTPKGTLTPLQEQFIAAGWELYIVRTEDDAINLVKRLRAA
jgi:hypothetical protein